MLKLEQLIFNPFSENTYILYDDTKECVIIDPGCSNKGEEDRLFGFIDSHQLKPLMAINTHGHVDHIIGNEAVKKRYGIPVAAHPDTKEAGGLVTDLAGGDFRQLIESIKERLFRLPDDTEVFSGHGESTTIFDEQRYNMFLG